MEPLTDYLYYLFWLIVFHAVCDYALQSRELGRLKDPTWDIEERDKFGPWWWSMLAHSLINGGGAAYATSMWIVGVGETIIHFITDTLKCVGIIGTKTDQVIHILSKVLWAFIAWRRIYGA